MQPSPGWTALTFLACPHRRVAPVSLSTSWSTSGLQLLIICLLLNHFLLWVFSPSCSELQSVEKEEIVLDSGNGSCFITVKSRHTNMNFFFGWLKDAVSHTLQLREVFTFPRLETKLASPLCFPQVCCHMVRSPVCVLLWHMASGAGGWFVVVDHWSRRADHQQKQFPSLQQEREEELSEDVSKGILGKAMEEMSHFECMK